MKDLTNRSLSAAFWGGGGSVGRIILQIATQIILARILGPAQYGLFAIGAIVISFSNFFSDIGIAYGLIQKPEVTDEDLRFIFTWQVIVGLLVTVLVALASAPIAVFFGDAEAQKVVAGLSIVCLFNALMAPSHNLLKRNLDFRRIQIGSLLGYFVGYVVVGVPLALAGGAVWALVAAWVVQVLVSLVIFYSGARHPLRPLFWFDGARQIAQYGATVLVTNITNWVIGNIDRVVVGRFFASREIGLYATAYNLLYSPVSSLLGIIQPIFFSAASRIADDRERVVRVHLALLALTALVVVPISVSVAAIADTFVLALYGPQWSAASKLLVPLALAMPFFLFWGFTTPLLWLGGAPEKEFRVQLPMAFLWLAVSWLAAQHSTAAVAWAVTLLFALRYLLIFLAARKLVQIPLASLWRAVRGGLFLSLACCLFVSAIDSWIETTGIAAFGRFLIDATLTATVYIGLLMYLPGLIAADCAGLLNRLEARSPAPLAGWLRRLPVEV